MAEVLLEGKTWSVQGFGPWLDLLEKSGGKRGRNSVISLSLQEAGESWAGKFLSRRFTNYVRGAPFFYSLGVSGAIRKFRRMGLLQRILDHEFYGWDPFSNASPPYKLIQDYRKRYPTAKGAFSRSGNYLTLGRSIRRESKEIVYDFVRDLMKSKIRPLVETGVAERTALSGYRVVPTATKSRQQIAITIPFGGPRNPIVGKIVRTLPEKEVAYMAMALETALSKRLRGIGVQAFVRGNHQLAPARSSNGR